MLAIKEYCVRLDKNKNVYNLYLCECGTEKVIRQSSVRAGKIVSCGCYHIRKLRESANRLWTKNIRHGMTKSREYGSWRSMKIRCTNIRYKDFHRYGGRGIRICDEWINSFDRFHADMGKRPIGMTLDRIDNDGNYEPGNCRWATYKQQRANQRKK